MGSECYTLWTTQKVVKDYHLFIWNSLPCRNMLSDITYFTQNAISGMMSTCNWNTAP